MKNLSSKHSKSKYWKFSILTIFAVYCIFISSSLAKNYPSLHFIYTLIEILLFIHVYKIFTLNKYKLNNILGVSYFTTLYPFLKEKHSKKASIFRFLIYFFFVYISITPLIITLIATLFEYTNSVLYYLLILPTIIGTVFFFLLKRKEWIKMGERKRI